MIHVYIHEDAGGRWNIYAITTGECIMSCASRRDAIDLWVADGYDLRDGPDDGAGVVED